MVWKVVKVQDVAVSICHSSDTHGMESLGWESPTKITLFELDEEYEIFEFDVKAALAEELIGNEEEPWFIKNKQHYEKFKKESFDFWMKQAEIICENLNKEYPNGLPSFEEE